MADRKGQAQQETCWQEQEAEWSHLTAKRKQREHTEGKARLEALKAHHSDVLPPSKATSLQGSTTCPT